MTNSAPRLLSLAYVLIDSSGLGDQHDSVRPLEVRFDSVRCEVVRLRFIARESIWRESWTILWRDFLDLFRARPRDSDENRRDERQQRDRGEEHFSGWLE